MAVERKLVDENKKRLLMAEYLHKETERAGFGGCEIQRTPLGLRVRLVVERPGFVIGRRGATIKFLTEQLESRFGVENPQIEVEESPNPGLSANIMAQKLAEALERGWHFRRAGHSTVRRIMESGGRGCEVVLTGKLTGARSRLEKFVAGHIKHCGEPSQIWMQRGFAVCKKKLGVIGVKVSIMDPNAVLPDEVTVAPSAIPAPAPVSTLPPTHAAPRATPADGETPEPITAPAGGSGTKRKLTDIPGVGPAKAKALEEAGFTFDAVVAASVEELAEVAGIGPKTAAHIKEGVAKLQQEEGAR